MLSRYDILIVGGGPAGLSAAISASGSGQNVLLVERNREIGKPVLCAEGITHLGLTSVVDLDRSWVSTEITGVRLFSPGGRTALIDHPRAGYVLNRDRFEASLAEKAGSLGVEIVVGCRAENLGRNGKLFTSIDLVNGSERRRVEFSAIIAADGIDSTIGREAGLTKPLVPSRLESCAQYVMKSEDIDPHIPEIWFSREFAPGGYAWIFPKGNGVANVGLGIVPTMAKKTTPFECLDDFVGRRFSEYEILSKSMGIVPSFEGRGRMLKANLMAVGDAARLIDSLTGAGISTALHSGRIAGEVAARYTANGGALSGLKEYPRRFMARFGRKLRFYRLGREVFTRMYPDEFDFVVGLVDEMFGGVETFALDPVGILRKVLTQQPSLLRHAPRIIWK